jgi:hypothetical protein
VAWLVETYPYWPQLIAQIGGQGPIPHDFESDGVHTPDNYADSGEGIVRERHVFWFGLNKPPGDTSGSEMYHPPEKIVLLMNMSGFNTGQNKWVLPTGGNVNIPWYYLQPGTSRQGASGTWTHPVSLTEWFADTGNRSSYIATINTLVSIIGSAVDAGGLAQAVAQSALTLIKNMPLVANAISSGQGGQVLDLLSGIGMSLASAVVSDPNTMQSFSQQVASLGPAGASLMGYVNTANKTVTNIVNEAGTDINQIIGSGKAYAAGLLKEIDQGVSIPGGLTPQGKLDFLTQLSGQDDLSGSPALSDVSLFPTLLASHLDTLIGHGAISSARSVLSGGFASEAEEAAAGISTSNPAAWFFDQATNALSTTDIVSGASVIPDYAQGFYGMGAALRSAQLVQQENPQFNRRTVVNNPRPGGGVPGSSFLSPIERAMQVQAMVSGVMRGGSHGRR